MGLDVTAQLLLGVELTKADLWETVESASCEHKIGKKYRFCPECGQPARVTRQRVTATALVLSGLDPATVDEDDRYDEDLDLNEVYRDGDIGMLNVNEERTFFGLLFTTASHRGSGDMIREIDLVKIRDAAPILQAQLARAGIDRPVRLFLINDVSA